MKYVGEIAPEIWQVLWVFFTLFWKKLTLCGLTFGQGHRHLGHWMPLIGLYLGTKYEVCRWNSVQDMTSSLFFFYTFIGKFDLDLWPWPRSRSSALRSLNAPYWVVPWYQVCTLLGCTLVSSMKSVGEIASEIWPFLWFYTHFWKIWPWPLTLGSFRAWNGNESKRRKIWIIKEEILRT